MASSSSCDIASSMLREIEFGAWAAEVRGQSVRRGEGLLASGGMKSRERRASAPKTACSHERCGTLSLRCCACDSSLLRLVTALPLPAGGLAPGVGG
mmetsp:Transcript_40158/g.84223  ORF Transcript_40158/g.84223 Transcript_40158/m.84223 type:complete len:97 (-) Transcript_40158:458-748(-)